MCSQISLCMRAVTWCDLFFSCYTSTSLYQTLVLLYVMIFYSFGNIVISFAKRWNTYVVYFLHQWLGKQSDLEQRIFVSFVISSDLFNLHYSLDKFGTRQIHGVFCFVLFFCLVYLFSKKIMWQFVGNANSYFQRKKKKKKKKKKMEEKIPRT